VKGGGVKGEEMKGDGVEWVKGDGVKAAGVEMKGDSSRMGQ
jgi:hypothetical protein